MYDSDQFVKCAGVYVLDLCLNSGIDILYIGFPRRAKGDCPVFGGDGRGANDYGPQVTWKSSEKANGAGTVVRFKRDCERPR